MKDLPKLGHHLEICFSVDNMEKSISFYEKIGFGIYTGGVDKGWCSMTDGQNYLALFGDNFIEKEFGVKILFNYRGGNVNKTTEALQERGIEFYKNTANEDGTGEALFKDINGNVFYLNTINNEDRIDVD